MESASERFGNVCGIRFGLKEVDKDQCHFELLWESIFRSYVDQFIIITTPDRFREHKRRHEHCRLHCECFEDDPINRIPTEVDYVLRPMFNRGIDSPVITENLKEAEVSFGGMMLAGYHLYKNGKVPPFTFAFWSCLKARWQQFKVTCDDADKRLWRVTILDKDFKVPEIGLAASRIKKATIVETEEELLLQGIRESFRSTFGDFDGQLLELHCISEDSERTVRGSAGTRVHIVPCFHIFVGEPHMVFPVGWFLKIYTEYLQTLPSKQSHLGFFGELYQMFYFSHIRRSILALFNKSMSKEWCGLTFLRDVHKRELDSRKTYDFLTIEPQMYRHGPFGNSASGALAAAIVQQLIYPDVEKATTQRYEFRGWTSRSSKPSSQTDHERKARIDRSTIIVELNDQEFWSVSASLAIS